MVMLLSQHSLPHLELEGKLGAITSVLYPCHIHAIFTCFTHATFMPYSRSLCSFQSTDVELTRKQRTWHMTALPGFTAPTDAIT